MLVRLPFFAIPLLAHAPAYAVGYWGASLVEDEEETQAQNKVVFALLLLVLVYGSMGVFVWAVLGYAPVGALLATAFVTLFARYHNSMINCEYPCIRDLIKYAHQPLLDNYEQYVCLVRSALLLLTARSL